MTENISIIKIAYAILAIISLSFLLVYKKCYTQNYQRRYMYTFLSITLIDFGHFLMSISRNLQNALFANRLIYFGTIFLLCTVFYIVSELCDAHSNKLITSFVHLVSLLMFLLVCTGGTVIKVYYKEVSFNLIDGVGHLCKIYGPLHNVYLIYVILLLFTLIVMVANAFINKKINNGLNQSLLIIAFLESVFIWIIQRFVDIRFEILTISYFIGEILLLILFHNIDKEDLSKTKIVIEKKTVEEVVDIWTNKYKITQREIEVLKLLLENVPRNEIAKRLFVSEHTIKKHTAHIYEKIGIQSRSELLYKLNEELTKTD